MKDKNIRMHQYYIGGNSAFAGAVDHDVLFVDLAAIIKKKGLNKLWLFRYFNIMVPQGLLIKTADLPGLKRKTT